MPIIHVYMWDDHPKEMIKEIMSEITEVFVKKGIPADAVRVLVHETPKSHWSVKGKPASEIDKK